MRTPNKYPIVSILIVVALGLSAFSGYQPGIRSAMDPSPATATSPQFEDAPKGMAVGPNGEVFVITQGRIIKYSPHGEPLQRMGSRR